MLVEADVGDGGDTERAVAEAVERFGGIDVLVNNGGVGDSARPRGEARRWEHTLRINLTGALLMAPCRAAATPVTSSGVALPMDGGTTSVGPPRSPLANRL